MPIIHKEHFMLTCSDELLAQGDYVADLIARHAVQGSDFVNGATFQVGWSILKLVMSGHQLELQEPDYAGNPFRDHRSDISASLRVLLAQNELVRQTHADPWAARFDEKIVVQKGCLSKNRVYMERSPQPSAGDSGWCIGEAGSEQSAPAPSDLESLYSFQLLSLRPALLSCLLLPPGWLVVWQGQKIEAVVNAENQVVLSELQ